MESQERRCFLLRFHGTGGKGKSGTVGRLTCGRVFPSEGPEGAEGSWRWEHSRSLWLQRRQGRVRKTHRQPLLPQERKWPSPGLSWSRWHEATRFRIHLPGVPAGLDAEEE